MNCIELFARKSLEHQNTMAFVSPYKESFTFLELRQRVERIQTSLLAKGIKPGDSVLIAIDITIDLYATIIAVMGLGATIVLVEPWMPVKRISEVIGIVAPKVFVSSILGNIWGMRVPEIRQIPHWTTPKKLLDAKKSELICEPVADNARGVITFTSGTTGTPKGVVREQGYLLRQFDVLRGALHFDQFSGSDLCIFANWALLNLAQGRPTVFFPSNWSKKNFLWLSEAAKKYNIETMTSGPAFIKALNETVILSTLKDIHVGGALTPNSLFMDLARNYPHAQIMQVYGSSEVEPVSMADARVSVLKSKEKNYFHSLYLGKPIEQIKYNNKETGMWVTGPHVCPFYLNNQRENELNKYKDDEGQIWHFMGDRISIDENQDWWYGGRAQLLADDFLKEQELYVFLEHDQAFIHRINDHEVFIIGEGVARKEAQLKAKFNACSRVIEAKIIKDNRHRARIDRKSILNKLKIG